MTQTPGYLLAAELTLRELLANPTNEAISKVVAGVAKEAARLAALEFTDSPVHLEKVVEFVTRGPLND